MIKNLVSVIIPAYKCENVISAAIDSALNQTYKNLEIIVVDDGSPDNTAKVVKKYNSRVRYIYQKNGGVSKARNTGINNSNGEYVAFLDADDVWKEEKVELQMEILNRHPDINMVFCAFDLTKNQILQEKKSYKNTFNFFKEYGYSVEDLFDSNSFISKNYVNIHYYWGRIYDYLYLGNFILPSSVLGKKESFIKCGLFNENFKIAEETELFLKYSIFNDIAFINYPLMYYEIPSTGNLSGKSNTEALIKHALKIQIDSFINNQLNHKMSYRFYLKGISTTYCRLAYYYLSEFRYNESKMYSRYSLKTYRWNIKPYMLHFLSYVPEMLLLRIVKIKKYFI